MRTYRPVPCLGIALGSVAPCIGCPHLVPSIDADQARIKPAGSDGRCNDFIAGRRAIEPVRVTPAASEGRAL